MFGGGTTLDDRLLAIPNSRVSDLNAVLQALEAYADFAFEDDVRFRTLFLKHYGQGGRAFHARGSRRPGAEALRQRIDAVIESGVFRKLDPDLALQVLWGAVHGVVALVLTAEGYPFAARTKLVDAAIENAIRGMTNPTRNRGSIAADDEHGPAVRPAYAFDVDQSRDLTFRPTCQYVSRISNNGE